MPSWDPIAWFIFTIHMALCLNEYFVIPYSIVSLLTSMWFHHIFTAYRCDSVSFVNLYVSCNIYTDFNSRRSVDACTGEPSWVRFMACCQFCATLSHQPMLIYFCWVHRDGIRIKHTIFIFEVNTNLKRRLHYLLCLLVAWQGDIEDVFCGVKCCVF